MSYDAPPPPPPGYGQSPYGAVPQGTNSKATWALVTGLLGLLCCSPLGIAAIILGRSAQQEIATTGQEGRGLAKAGFVLGVIAVAFLVLQIILVVTGVVSPDDFDNFDTTS
jgi:ABC-type Fe3+ transport system permease subunit